VRLRATVIMVGASALTHRARRDSLSVRTARPARASPVAAQRASTTRAASMSFVRLSRAARHRAAPLCRATTQPRFSTTDKRRIRPSIASIETRQGLPCPVRPPLEPTNLGALGLHFP